MAKVSKVKLQDGESFKIHPLHIAATQPDGSVDLYNMTLSQEEESSSYKIAPGAFRITPKAGLQKIDFPDVTYFETEQSVQLKNLFIKCFRNKIDVFKRANIIPKRGILIGSPPGAGKSSCINHLSKEIIQESPNSCVLYMDSTDISIELLYKMFREATEDSKVKFIILVIEDIGGTKLQERAERIDCDLLNFLDGAPGVFNIPTLIIGTTNYLDELSSTLTERPGRFDDKIVVQPPNDKACKILANQYSQVISNRALTEDECGEIIGKGFTPAYIKEIVLRAELYEISIADSAKQLGEQRKQAQKGTHMTKEQGEAGFKIDPSKSPDDFEDDDLFNDNLKSIGFGN
jgi:SpoVK/Ycf46/Vps4 family AAA+-type ATPase